MSQESNFEIQRDAKEPSHRRRRALFESAVRALGGDRAARHVPDRCDDLAPIAPMLTTLIDPLWNGVRVPHHAGSHRLLRQLRERLAFVRTSTRLYEALLTMLEAAPAAHQYDVSRDNVVRFRSEEAAHFELLCECIESLGTDPLTFISADRAPPVRVDLARQGAAGSSERIANTLQHLLDLKRTDRSAWELLVATARTFGHDELARRFGHAWSEAAQHVHQLRAWTEWICTPERRRVA